MKEENQHNSEELENVDKMLSETIESKQKIDDDYSTSVASLSLFSYFYRCLYY